MSGDSIMGVAIARGGGDMGFSLDFLGEECLGWG